MAARLAMQVTLGARPYFRQGRREPKSDRGIAMLLQAASGTPQMAGLRPGVQVGKRRRRAAC